jgi:hypothetical protein
MIKISVLITKIYCLLILLNCVSFNLIAGTDKINSPKYSFVKIINDGNKYPITIKSKKSFFLPKSANKKADKLTIQPRKTLLLFFKDEKTNKKSNNPLKLTVNNYSTDIDFSFSPSGNRINSSKEMSYNNIKWNFYSNILDPSKIKILEQPNHRFILTKNMLLVKKSENNVFEKLNVGNSTDINQNKLFFSNSLYGNFSNIIFTLFPKLKSFFTISLNRFISNSKFSILTPLIVKNRDTGVSLNFSIVEGSTNKNLKLLNSIIFIKYKVKDLKNKKIKYKKIEAGTIKGFGKLVIQNIPLPGKYKNISISDLSILVKITNKNDFSNHHSFSIKNISLLGCTFSQKNPYGLEGALNKDVYQMKVDYQPTGIELTGPGIQ